MFNDKALSALRLTVSKNISEKRYKHTLGVEKMARYLGEIILPDKVNELSAAALLHDIAKEHSYEDHLDLVSTLDYITKDDLQTPSPQKTLVKRMHPSSSGITSIFTEEGLSGYLAGLLSESL